MFVDFHSSFEDLAALMQRSWSENSQQPLLYSAQHLASAFTQPGASPALAPALYEEGKLVAFGAGFPRTVRYAQQTLSLVLDSFITVGPTHKGLGLGCRIWTEIARRAQALGHDGLVTYCVEGDAMNHILPKCSARANLDTRRVLSIRYLARPLRPQPGPLTQADPLILKSCADHLAASLPLARIWSAEQAAWQCQQRDGAFGSTLVADGASGTISGYTMLSAGSEQILCGIIDDVLWGELAPLQRRELVGHLLRDAAARGVRLLLLPMLEYAHVAPLREAGFRLTQRTLHMYITSWRDGVAIAPLSAAYLDVF
ncbi:MAG: hypothetical protein NVS9B15_12460 [Acidobacteriaceae bacterium]